MAPGGGSNYYINVAIDPTSLAKAKQAILSLARDAQAAQTLNLFGGDQARSALAAARSVQNLSDAYRQQVAVQRTATASVQTSAKAEASAVEQAEGRKQRAKQRTAEVAKAAEPAAKPTGPSVADRTMTAAQYRAEDSERRRRAREARLADAAPGAVDADPRRDTRQSAAEMRREFERKQAAMDAKVAKEAQQARTQLQREERDARNKQWIAARQDYDRQFNERQRVSRQESDSIRKASEARRTARANAARQEIAQTREVRDRLNKEVKAAERDAARRVEEVRRRQTPSPYPGTNVNDEVSSLRRMGSDGNERGRATDRIAAEAEAREQAKSRSLQAAEAQREREVMDARRTQWNKAKAEQKALDADRERAENEASRERQRQAKQRASEERNARGRIWNEAAAEQRKLDRQQAKERDAQRVAAERAAGKSGVTQTANAAPSVRDNKGMRELLEYQRAGLASSNVFARGLASLSTEMNNVGGTTTGASNAIVRGAGSMRLMAAATAETTARLGLYAAGAAVLFGVVNVLGQIKNAALDADSALTDLSRVVDASSFDRSAGSSEMIRLMRELALGANDVGEAFFEMGKLMDSQQEAIAGSEAILLATKIAELDVAAASQQLVKVMKAFGLEATDLEGILDKLNDQQNRLGVDIGKSLIGISRAAGVTKTVGGELDSLVARITVLQRLSGFAPETVSRANQRIAIQLATLKGQRRIADALTTTGTKTQKPISLVDKEGEVRNIDDLLSEIGKRYDSFNSETQANISLALTGGYAGGLSALTTTLLQNYGEVETQINNVKTSQGSAREELAVTMTSMRNQIALLGTELQAIGVNLADSGILTILGIMVRLLRESLEVVNDVLSGFNQLPNALRQAALAGGAFAAAVRVRRGVARINEGARQVTDGAAQTAAPISGQQRTAAAAIAASRAAESAAVKEAQAKVAAAAATVRSANAAAVAEAKMNIGRDRANARIGASYPHTTVAAERLTAAMQRLASAQTHAAQTATAAAAASRASAAAEATGLRGRLRGGQGIAGAGLLAAIIGSIIADETEKGSNLNRAGSVASAAGTGALLGTLVPGLGNLVGGGLGAGIGAVAALYKDQTRAQKEAESSLYDLTASVRKLRSEQERAADSVSQEARVPALVESDAAAERFANQLNRATAQLEGTRSLVETTEGAQTEFNVQSAIDQIKQIVDSGPPGASSDSKAQLAALKEVQKAIQSEDTVGLSIENMLNAFPETAAQALTAALKNADGGVSNKDAARIGGRITPSFISGGLDEGYIQSQIASLDGINKRRAEEIASSVQQQLVRGMVREMGAALTGDGEGASGRLRDIADVQTALQGGFGAERKVQELETINQLFNDYFSKMAAAADAPAGKKGDKARDEAQAAADVLERSSNDFALAFGIDEGKFREAITQSLENERVPKFIRGFAEGLASYTTKAKSEFSVQDADQIVGLSEESLAEMAAGTFNEFENYAETINGLNALVSADNLDPDEAVRRALSNVVLIKKASQSQPGDVDLAKQVQEVEASFQSLIGDRVSAIREQMEAGTLDRGDGASEILTLLSRVTGLRDRVPKSVRQSALVEVSKTINDIAGAQADKQIKSLQDSLKRESDPDRRRPMQAKLNLLKRAKSNLQSALEAGGNLNSGRVRKALADLGITEVAIGAMEVANAGVIAAATRKRLAMNRVFYRKLLASQRKLASALRSMGLMSGASKISADASETAERIASQSERIDRLDKELAAGDEELANAIQAGADGATGDSPLGQESDPSTSAAEKAKQAAEEARQRAEEQRQQAQDLVSARFEYLRALAGDDPVKVARLELREQQELAKFARGAAERLRAKAAIINARRALREAVLEQAGGSQTFGIPNDVRLPTAFELKQVAGRYARSGAGAVGAVNGQDARTQVNMTANNRNSITIVVANEADRKRVVEAVSVATGADAQAMRSNGFSGGGLI